MSAPSPLLRRAGAALSAAALTAGALTAAAITGASAQQQQRAQQPRSQQQQHAQQQQQPGPANAQQPSGPPNALQGFSQNRGKPIKINSASLEVHDKDKMATFSGDVHLVQGDVDLRTNVLVVFYEDASSAQSAPASAQDGRPAPVPASAAAPSQQGAGQQGAGQQGAGQDPGQQDPGQQDQSQQIKRVEAKGDVIVVQKDQTATGDLGIFDMRANTVEMTGNVVVNRGPNILRGDTLTVNMNTGDSLMTCGKAHEKCRVQGLFLPGTMKDSQAAPAPAPAPAPTRR